MSEALHVTFICSGNICRSRFQLGDQPPPSALAFAVQTFQIGMTGSDARVLPLPGKDRQTNTDLNAHHVIQARCATLIGQTPAPVRTTVSLGQRQTCLTFLPARGKYRKLRLSLQPVQVVARLHVPHRPATAGALLSIEWPRPAAQFCPRLLQPSRQRLAPLVQPRQLERGPRAVGYRTGPCSQSRPDRQIEQTIVVIQVLQQRQLLLGLMQAQPAAGGCRTDRQLDQRTFGVSHPEQRIGAHRIGTASATVGDLLAQGNDLHGHVTVAQAAALVAFDGQVFQTEAQARIGQPSGTRSLLPGSQLNQRAGLQLRGVLLRQAQGLFKSQGIGRQADAQDQPTQ